MQSIMLLLSSIMLIKFDNNIDIDYSYVNNQIEIGLDNFENEYDDYYDTHYFNGEYIDDIASKIEKYFNSTLNGKGYFVAEYSLKKGVDPYLVSGVILQETGCYWGCSRLVKTCNNVGGQKGKPSCNGGSYRKFDSLEEGLKFTINKISKYYNNGYTTAKEINKYYATDKTWYKKVNNYMKKIKNS